VYALYRDHYRLRQYGGLVVCAVLALMALMTAGFWWSQRDRLYLVFCLASATGVLRVGDRLIEHPPLPWPLWGVVTAWALTLHLVLMIYFALMLVNRQQLLDALWFRAMVAIDVLVGAAAYLLGLPILWTLVLTSLTVPAVLSWLALAQAAWQQRSGQAIAAFVAGSALVSAGIRDWWVVRLHGDGAGTLSLMPHAVVLFALLMGAVLVQRFARVAGEHRALAVTLDERVRQREAELLRRHAELRQEYAHQAALQERQRLMRDIHDGVGVQLVGLLDLLERDALPRQVLRDQVGTALDELRMAVDALQPVHGDLTTVLATLRYRLRPRLEAAGIAIDWQVDELPPIEGLTPTTVLQIQRVLQEAFTNAMRHAQAQRLWVRAWLDSGPPERLVLSVEDDGRGFQGSDEASTHGNGLASMHARAQAIGAELEIGAGPRGGTLLSLALPAQRGAGAAT
jgi:signal transduction histidine kinase